MHTGKKVSTFRDRIIELFNDSGKNNTELAEELHVSNQTISAWKSGKRSPIEPTIMMIADHFGVQVDWLFGFDVEKDSAIAKMYKEMEQEAIKDEERQKVSELYISLNEENRKAALKYMEYLKSQEG